MKTVREIGLWSKVQPLHRSNGVVAATLDCAKGQWLSRFAPNADVIAPALAPVYRADDKSKRCGEDENFFNK